ncbi:MAG TPA: flippase [Candidatus Moranbacteria bacterium]|nr:flippase [Candidatus Moranbacteria bacterium]
MRVARKIAYNVVVSSVAKVLATVLALVSIGLITRYLGKEGFGNYATVLAFFSFFGALSDLGLYSISTREISRPGADQERIMSNMFTIRIISSLVVLVISPAIVIFFPYPIEVKYGIVVAAAAYLFSSAYQILNGVFQKNLAMDKVAISELAGKVLQVIIIFLAIKFELSFGWVISSLLFYMIFSFILVFFWSRRFVKIRLRFDFSYWKKFLKESYPVGISAIVIFMYFKLDTILLSVMKSSADVGIYSAAYKVLENITFFPSMIMGLIFPIMSQSIFADREKFKDVSNKTFKIFVLTIVPLIVGTLFLSEGIISLIGGAGFSESAAVLEILVFALALIFFGNFFNSIMIAGNLQKKLLFVLSGAAIINISLNYLFIPRFSYFGAAGISVITEMVVAGIGFVVVYKNLKYKPVLENWAGIFFSGLAMAVFLFFFQNQNFFVVGAASVLVYGLFLWIFRAVKTNEITSIISRKGVEEYEQIA